MVLVILSHHRVPALDRLSAKRRSDQRDAQLPEAVERLAGAARAAQSLGSSLLTVATSTPPPLGPELGSVADAIAHGTPVERAVTEWTATTGGSRDVELVATALALSAYAGGEVGRALDRAAATLRERRELRGEARALATQARASAGVLTVAPIVFAFLVSAVEPGVVEFLVASPPGLACLATGLVLDALGAWWMARIMAEAR